MLWTTTTTAKAKEEDRLIILDGTFFSPPPFIWTCIFYEVVYLNHVNKPFTRFMWFGWAFYGFWYSRFLAFQFAKCTNCLFDTTNIDTFPAQDDYSAINIACSPVQVKYPSKISNTCMRTSIYSFARYSEVGMFVYIKYIQIHKMFQFQSWKCFNACNNLTFIMIIWNIFQFRKLASLPDVMPKNESKRREIPPENYKSIREFGAQNFDCLEWICLRFYLNLETMQRKNHTANVMNKKICYK